MTRIDPYSDRWDDFTKKLFRLSRDDLVGMLDSLQLPTWTSDFDAEKGELVGRLNEADWEGLLAEYQRTLAGRRQRARNMRAVRAAKFDRAA